MPKHLGAVSAALVFAAIIGVSPAALGDASSGQALFAGKGCPACHGQDGRQSVDAIPVLAGQNAEYLLRQMKDVAGGQRVSRPGVNGEPRTKAMKDAMTSVSQAEMKVMADWLATMPPASAGDATSMAAGGADLYEEFGCMGCHGVDGMTPLHGYPVLAGQNKEYLALQMKEIRDVVRTNGRSRVMIEFARNLKDDQAERIAAYLSQVDRATAKP